MATFSDIDGKIYNPDRCEPLEQAEQQNEIELCALSRDHYPGFPLKKGELPGIKSIGYWNATKKQKWDLDWHCNEGIEICYLEAGNIDFCVNDRKYNLSPRHLTITRPWLPHRIEQINRSRLHWFILDVKVRFPHQKWIWPNWIILNKTDLNRLTQILQQNEQPVWVVNQSIKHCFTEIGNIIRKREGKYYDSIIRTNINHILILLLEIFEKNNLVLSQELTSSKRSVMLFLKRVETIYNEPLTLENMAEYCGLGTTQFSKYCQELTNCSPMKYLNDIRIEKACNLLKSQPCKKVTDIAYDTGFSSNQYFTKVFTERMGVSPNKFRDIKSRPI